MKNTKPNHQQEDSGKAHSSGGGRGPAQTIIRFFNRTNAVLMFAAVACALPAQSQAQTVVSFDPPGAISTTVNGISPAGEITGNYTDINTNYHSFLRTSDGQYTTFDEPGAATNLSPNSLDVNSAGEIIGTYERDAGEFSFGGPPETFYLAASFLRLPDGAIFNIDPTNAFTSTPSCINDQGTVVGTCSVAASDGSVSDHFYLRAANGTYTEFDAEAGTMPIQIAINPDGTVTGSYFDSNFDAHSFLRTAKGTVTTFDVPGAVDAPFAFNGTEAGSINPSGLITGSYTDTNSLTHGFLRSKDGQFTTFDPQGSTGTYPSSDCGNAPDGVVAGTYTDANGVYHGFVRAKNGQITTFDPEGSTGTFVAGITPSGVVTGNYNDSNGVSHGFVF